MANIKITDLTAYTDAASTDVLPIVDVGADVTKKIAISDIVKAVPQGTAALPGLAFDGDPDTGLFSAGADQVGLATNGTGRLFIDANGNVGVGSANASTLLHLSQSSSGAAVVSRIENTNTAADSDAALDLKTPNAVYTLKAKRSGTRCDFEVDGSPKLSIDTSGRLLVGTSSSRQVNASIAALQLQIEGTAYQSSSMSLVANQNAADGSYIVLGKSRGTSLNSSTIVNSGDSLGAFWFCGADGYTMPRGATIEAQVDGTPGANDMPGRLVFSVTQDGSASPTEAMRIKNTRVINFSNAPVYADNAAAKTGGLVDGDVYRTSTGDLKIVYT